MLSQGHGASALHYLHALDYLAYAYLRIGEDDKAFELIQTMVSYPAPFGKINRDAQAYAFAAARARKDWAAAAVLEPRLPEQFPWESSHAPYVALTHFSRGLGLHTGTVSNKPRLRFADPTGLRRWRYCMWVFWPRYCT